MLSVFVFILIGGLNCTSVYMALPELQINRVAMCDQSKLWHIFMNKLSEMYSGVFCNFLLERCCCHILGTAKLVNIKIAAEDELNYYCDRGRQL